MRQRTSIEIFNYWEQIRGPYDAPLRSQIEPASVRHILPELFILEATVSDAPRFRLAGTRICSIFGRELRDEGFSLIWGGGQPDDPVRIAMGVMAYAVPALINATGYSLSGRHMAFEVVLMPVRSSADVCDRLLGCITPALSATWLGAEPVEFLALDRSRLLMRSETPAETAPKSQEPAKSLFVSKGTEFSDAMRRVLHLKIFEGGRAR